MTNILEIKQLTKNYQTINGEIEAIKDISFDLRENEILAIVGSSGCGKSTILSIIAGNMLITKGIINSYKPLNIGYMLQSDALFPWLTVWENIMLGVKIKDKKNILLYHEDGITLLKKYNLLEFKDKYTSELSGGMKQRVALIRTLILKPDVLLLDEPFSALDYQSRKAIAKDVKKIIKEREISAIIVTHDISEALTFADRILVLSKRPCYIKKEFIVDNKNIDFNKTYEEVWKELDSVV